ncbi:unnamed protein product [Calypogeia fissa]
MPDCRALPVSFALPPASDDILFNCNRCPARLRTGSAGQPRHRASHRPAPDKEDIFRRKQSMMSRGQRTGAPKTSGQPPDSELGTANPRLLAGSVPGLHVSKMTGPENFVGKSFERNIDGKSSFTLHEARILSSSSSSANTDTGRIISLPQIGLIERQSNIQLKTRKTQSPP